MVIIYTDDCLLFTQNNATIDSVIHTLSKYFLLKDQGTAHDYLGTCIQKDITHKTITMSQLGLI